MYCFKVLEVLLSIFYCAWSYKILVICEVPTLSHYGLASKLSKEIVKKGHEVTFASPYAQKVKIKNLTEIPIENLQMIYEMKVLSGLDRENLTALEQAMFLNDVLYNLTTGLLSSEHLRNLLKSKEHYDAVILHHYFSEALLAHTNVKAFISHGGLLSTMKSVYYAVPIIGIPIYGDQKMNMAFAKSYDYATEVPYRELTEEKLSDALKYILSDQKYKENIAKRSKIMRDRPIKPLERALYWIEYVIRHQGAPHLRYGGMDLNWWQRNLLDVVAFIIVTRVLLVVTY